MTDCTTERDDGYDYIIVGSGAGGGPLASRLAQNGKRVLVLEAGANHAALPPRDPAHEISRVPALHAASTEHEALAWRFFVKHYETLPAGVPADPKWHHAPSSEPADQQQEGIFYPRAAAVGGCTVHNAMITIAGPDSDWDQLAHRLGDSSWRGEVMRGYFKRLEHNDYLPLPEPAARSAFARLWDYVKESCSWLFGFDPDRTRGGHGFDGWLHTSVADASIGLKDAQLIRMLKAALWQAKVDGLDRAWTWTETILKGQARQALDPNHATTKSKSPEGISLIPLAVYGDGTTIHQERSTPWAIVGRRSSPRELLLSAQAAHPDKLEIRTHCLVTRVLFNDPQPGDKPRAIGVEYQVGERLYRAHVTPSSVPGETKQVFVKAGGEVVLCGGAFNTPQLLMLSGVGDRQELEGKRIEVRANRPGVGKNLQDRYEVSVVSELPENFEVLAGAALKLPDDPDQPDDVLREWREDGTGLYASNGAVLGIFKRSRPELPQPDLFIFGVPSEFRGYEVGYSNVAHKRNLFTWVVLKSHTRNRDGVVQLRSANPLDTPLINFHYFNSASAPLDTDKDPDLLALVKGVKFIRGILSRAGKLQEVHPGPEFQSDEAAKRWIRRDAWGHHACGTCRMGTPDDPYAVLDSRFRVIGVDGLRVCDASIFPEIPGYFIVTNIYVAAEKAADTLLADAEQRAHESTHYPRSLQTLEHQALTKRRRATQPPHCGAGLGGAGLAESAPASCGCSASPPIVQGDRRWNDDVTGLALSGGGVRSATLSLGLLQVLARNKLLRKVDFLSTVSGGGYIGAALGRLYDRFRGPERQFQRQPAPLHEPPADCVEKVVADRESNFVDWLRRSGNYLSPNGAGDGRVNAAIYFRNLLSVHFVVGVALVALFSLANSLRYGVLDQIVWVKSFGLDIGDLPITHVASSLAGPKLRVFLSPWFGLTELLFLFLVLPQIVSYWIVSPSRPQRFRRLTLSLLFVASAALLWFSVQDGLQAPALVFALSLLSSLIHVEMAWYRGVLREAATGTGGLATQRLRTRNYLTYDLGMSLVLLAISLGFGFIDSLAHGLHEWKLAGNYSYAQAFSALGAAVVAVMPVARYIAGGLASGSAGAASVLPRFLKRDMTLGLLALVLFTAPMVLYSFASHAAFQGGDNLARGVLVTIVTAALTLVLAHPSTISFVNNSSLAQTYAARLARAYLGASNPVRYTNEGRDVTEVATGDDVAAITDYRPHEASGPLHLINVTVNQTLEYGARLRRRDRQGEIVAVSCLGVSVGEDWHGQWRERPDIDPESRERRVARLEPLGRLPGEPHPLVDQWEHPAANVETLSLRQWIGISGAAIDPGRGAGTRLGTALLMGLVNLRTGHWWDTGIPHAHRLGFPDGQSPLRRFIYLIPRVLGMQSLILAEWLAKFPGPWQRFWHLSDGGFFDNTGLYELVRRRVPRMILCDGSADPRYELEDLGDVIRKVRIDFNAEIKPFSTDDLATYVPDPLRTLVGVADQLKPVDGRPSAMHAALFWVRYIDPSNPRQFLARRSVLLYLKASLSGDESIDVQMYQKKSGEFPHDPTSDQFFDESQWESYRALGEHMASPLFANQGAWFWNIQVEHAEEPV